MVRRAGEERVIQEEREAMRKRGHECPVPKPRGWVGEVLGFRGRGGGKDGSDGENGGGER